MEKELLSKLNAFDTHDNIMVSILAGTELEVDISETGRDKIFAYAMRDSAGVVKRIMLCTDNFNDFWTELFGYRYIYTLDDLKNFESFHKLGFLKSGFEDDFDFSLKRHIGIQIETGFNYDNGKMSCIAYSFLTQEDCKKLVRDFEQNRTSKIVYWENGSEKAVELAKEMGYQAQIEHMKLSAKGSNTQEYEIPAAVIGDFHYPIVSLDQMVLFSEIQAPVSRPCLESLREYLQKKGLYKSIYNK